MIYQGVYNSYAQLVVVAMSDKDRRGHPDGTWIAELDICIAKGMYLEAPWLRNYC